jgi:UDP-N-acetylmuramate dehydrogenase
MLERTRELLASWTTLRLGGRASRFIVADSEEAIVDAVAGADSRGDALFVLGGGSNVVVGDEGHDGVVVKIASRGVRVARESDGVRIVAAAGEPWDDLVARCVDEGWSGVACMSGIPGLVGATPIQNVGAYGQELADTATRVRVFDREARALVDLSRDACAFTYRDSMFKRTSRYVVVEVELVLRATGDSRVRYAELERALGVASGASAPSRAIRDTVLRLRRAKGMVVDDADPESVSAGSFFVNPVCDAARADAIEARARELGVTTSDERMPRFAMERGRFKLSAGWLIERSGFRKGYGDGRVGISTKHALALVHRGGGTTRELLDLARVVRDGVAQRFGVVLVPEPVLVGCAL